MRIYLWIKMQTRNTKKKLNEIKKGIVLGLLLTSFYGIGAYIYKTKIRIDKDLVKRFSKTASLKELENGLKEEYCNAVKEIKKVDKEIVPGTNIPFKEATYIQVHDAYKEYLQKIAQIKQAISLTIENKDIERETGCYYEPTRWDRVNNLNYRLKNFL